MPGISEDKLLNVVGAGSKDVYCFKALSLKERIMGYGTCQILGWVLYIISFVHWIVKGSDMRIFAILFFAGTVLNIIGSGFLSGFKEQVKTMTDPKRVVTAAVFLLTAIATITIALVMSPGKFQTVLIIIGVIVQYAAFFWYNLSFIPYGQKLVTKAAEKAVTGETG